MTVYLVGAGPGDPGLLTLRGADLLRQCDVVIHDRLIGGSLLDIAPAHAERIDVGKARGSAPVPQADINAMLVERGRAGLCVVRLKGGDPFVFARGGEEALALAAAGIPFRIVPGITAGIGGLAYAGIPVTHRDINSAVTFVTGHSSDGAVPDGVDWEAIAGGSPVIVLYMGLRHIAAIAARLIAAGRMPDEAVAIVSKATTPAQRVVVTSLAKAAGAARAAGIEGPTIIAIGEVVRLRAALDWIGGEKSGT